MINEQPGGGFLFLLAIPRILAAGVLNSRPWPAPAGADIHGQVLVGALVAGLAWRR